MRLSYDKEKSVSRVKTINERLREAATAGVKVELKAVLNDSECNVYSTDGFGGTALMYAASHGHAECVQLLLSVADTKGKDIYGVTALIYAVSGGHEACVRILLPVSDVLAVDDGGQTAIDWARKRGLEGLAQSIDTYIFVQNEQAASRKPRAMRLRVGP